MSLHNAVDIIKKMVIGAGIGSGVIILLIFMFRIGSFFIRTFNPPPVTPPNQAFGDLNDIKFPNSIVDNNFSYILNTVTGTLPTDFPDRLAIYPISPREPSLLNLDKAREKARALRFTNEQGKILPEASLGNGKYQWSDQSELNRQLIFDIITFNFSLSSNYLSALSTLSAQRLGNEQNAINTVENFLNSIQLLPEDIDLDKTRIRQENESYNTYPKLFDIVNGALIPTSSLSTAKVIRVDLYQKNIEYDLETGVKDASPLKINLPIRYPKPPFSSMSFWIASNQTTTEVTAAEFMHQPIDKSNDTQATYPIISAKDAYSKLENGDAYIASYQGLDQQILIDNIYLAYYLGAENQEYFMPIIVFEGQDNFFAYVSAIKN